MKNNYHRFSNSFIRFYSWYLNCVDDLIFVYISDTQNKITVLTYLFLN